jgi:hypothetical protein
MSLNFNLEDVKKRLGDERWEEVTTHPEDLGKEKKRWHPVTDTLIWKTMSIDLGEITEANLDEWWFRVRLLQLLDGGPELHGGIGSFYLTRQDIDDHIGLSTNVSDKSRAEWLKRVLKKLSDPPQKDSANKLIRIALKEYAAKQETALNTSDEDMYEGPYPV